MPDLIPALAVMMSLAVAAAALWWTRRDGERPRRRRVAEGATGPRPIHWLWPVGALLFAALVIAAWLGSFWAAVILISLGVLSVVILFGLSS